MGQIDTQLLIQEMTAAAAGVLGSEWLRVENDIMTYLAEIADTIEQIENLKNQNHITEARAQQHLRMAMNTKKALLETECGLSKIAAERAISAAQDAIRDIVNIARLDAILKPKQKKTILKKDGFKFET